MPLNNFSTLLTMCAICYFFLLHYSCCLMFALNYFSFLLGKKATKDQRKFCQFLYQDFYFSIKGNIVLPHTTARTNAQECAIESIWSHRQLTFAFG